MAAHDTATADTSASGGHYELLIVGAGIFGTSTAYHLSRLPNPPSIAVVDRTPFPPSHAASTDINKIVRADYTSPFYMDLAFEAMEAWNSWPELKDKGYYHRTGWVNLNEKGSDLAERIRGNFRERHHDPTSDITLEDLRYKFNAIFRTTDFSGCTGAYHNPEAGWCDAASATAELMKAAVDRGTRYLCEDVVRLVLGEQRVQGVQTSEGKTVTADKVLMCTGAWTSSLLSPVEDALAIPSDDRIERQLTAAGVCVAHFKLDDDELEQLKDMPVIIYAANGDCQPPPANNLLKMTNARSFTNTITTASGHRISVPPERGQHVVSQKLQHETFDLIAGRLMPQFTTSKPVDYWRLCWDAITPTQDHLISRHPHPKLQNLFIAVGGSFHSYKFLPNIGKYIINALDGRSNGVEQDRHFAWKAPGEGGRGAHEKAYPTRELSSLDD